MHDFPSFLFGAGALACLVGIVIWIYKRFRHEHTISLLGREVQLVLFLLVVFIVGGVWMLISLLIGSPASQQEGAETSEAFFEDNDDPEEADTGAIPVYPAHLSAPTPYAAPEGPYPPNEGFETETIPDTDPGWEDSDQPTDHADTGSDLAEEDDFPAEEEENEGAQDKPVKRSDYVGPDDQVGAGDHVGPRDQVDPDDHVGQGDQVGDNDRIGDGDQVGVRNSIGQNDQVQPKDQIGPRDQVGSQDQVGPQDQIGPRDFVQP